MGSTFIEAGAFGLHEAPRRPFAWIFRDGKDFAIDMTYRASGPHQMTPDSPMDPREAVNSAIQKLVPSRLGRGFIPLGLLFVWGSVAMFFGGDLLLPASGMLSGAAMLGYGLR